MASERQDNEDHSEYWSDAKEQQSSDHDGTNVDATSATQAEDAELDAARKNFAIAKLQLELIEQRNVFKKTSAQKDAEILQLKQQIVELQRSNRPLSQRRPKRRLDPSTGTIYPPVL